MLDTIKDIQADRILHLAVHVHNAFANNPASFVNPRANPAANNLVNLGHTLRSAGIQTHCALLADHAGNESIDEAYGGVFEPLKTSKLFNSYSRGYMASCFGDYSLRGYISPEKYDVLIITGFNRSMCAGETALDAIKEGYKVIMPLDCCEDYVSKWTRNDIITVEQLEEAGVILCQSGDIYNALEIKEIKPDLGLKAVPA